MHPDEIVRKCREKLTDTDNLTPSEEKKLKAELATNETKQDYYAAKAKVMETEGFLSWLFF